MRRRKAGFLGFFLLPSGFVKTVAGGLAVVMVLTATGDSAGNWLGDRGSYAWLHGPGQVWGEAAGAGTHFEGRPENRTLPASTRGRYPKQVWDQKPDNTVTEAEAPAAEVKGFDEKTSTEQAARRTDHERVYTNTDGTETTEFSTSKLNYRGKDGAWTPIDPTLVDDQGKGWRNAADEVGISFAKQADAADLVTLAVDENHSVSYTLAGAAASAPKVDGATITYPAVRSKVDLKLESRPGGVKETLVLSGPDAPTSFTFPLRLKGLTPRISDGQVVFTDEKGATRAVIPPGDMVDAKGVVSKGVAYRLAGGALELTVDAGWLTEPGRAFPVAVDPTVQLPVNSGSADASMTAGSAGSGELAVGSNANAYIKFGDLVNRLQFHTIFGAQLWMVNFEAESCAPRPVSVHPVTENWSSGSGTYPGPAVGGALASKSFAHGYIAFGESSSACPRAGELFNLGGAGRDLVQRWVNGEQPNYGLSIRGPGAKKFTDRGTANPPKLYVTHSPYNATYKLTDPRPNPPVLQNQDGKVKIQVTNKSASAWAPGDYYLAYRAYKADGSAFGQQRAANLTTTVQRNGKVTLDATIKAMPPGKYFLDFTMVRTGGTVFTDHQVPPGRIVLQVFDIPPVLQELFPPNGYQAPTLTPQLWARALDVDAPPSVNLQFKFEICERDAAGKPINCTNSGYGTKTAWTVPAGTLSWSKAYLWRAFVKDATTDVPSQYSTLLTNVPQPEITARVSSSPGGLQERDFDPQTGNFTTSAVDAAATTAGPALSVTRTYNSIDSRRDGMFGAGWTSVFDMKVVPDDDGSGSVVVTYADGQTVRFGRNANGTYVPPTGRTVSLTQDSSSWKLLDQSGTTYQFALTGKLSKITDVSNRSIVLTYQDGKLRKAQVANSQTNTAGRSLTFTWTGNHVTKLDTDPVGGAALSWNYSYTGDLLTKVCGPTPGCTNYEHSAGSHYRSAVLDSRPESYWRLGEDEGTTAASEVATNLGKDSGTYRNVTLNAAGALAGTTDTAASFNGTSSTVDLPKGTVKKSRDGAVELWFRNSLTGSGGPLIGYQDKALGSASTTGVPVLYVGTDGKLRGQFGTGSVNPITSPGQVNEGRWHHVVLSSMGSTQTLYLDGVKIGELTGKTIDHSLLTFNQIGAAYASTPGSWPAWGTTAQKSYNGMIDDVALYSGPLGAASVAAHYQAAITQADLMSKVTLPSGRVDSIATYDVGRDRVKQYTDDNGGVWKVGAPTVYGGDTDLRRSIEVLDPGNRTSLYEFDALSGQLLRLGMPLGMETRSEDKPGEPAETPPDPVRQCTQPDPNDPAFCTVIPDDSGGPVFVRYGVDGLSIRTFEYNDDGVLTTVRDENGNPTTMTYDARGNVTSTKTCRDTSANQCNTSYKSYPATVTNLYDPRNNLPTESRDARSSSATDNTYRIQYAYHPSGQLATQTSPDGTQTSYRYTTGGEGAVGGGTQPAGLVDSMTNARGKITKYAYYANGDLAKVTEPSGRSTEYTYDALGRMISKKDVSDSFTAGVVTTYTYDGMSRLRTTTLPVTTNAVTNVKHQKRITNTYDSDGNVTAVEVADALGNDPARITSSTLDEHGRTITTTDPEGGQTWFDHDAFGNVTSTTDPNGNRYDFAYTGRNTIAEVRLRDWRSDPAGAPATTGDYLVLEAYSYDFAGRLASRTDAMGRRIEYTYFDDGLLAKAVLKKFRNPDGTTRDYVLEDNTYDGDGNPTRQVTANGKTVKTTTYDKLGRVATSTADPAGLMRGTAFTYDSNGNVKTVTTTGKPSNVPWVTGNSQEQVTYDYDDADNVTQETISNGTVSRVTRTRYDQRGLATSTIDPRGNAAGADPNAFTARLTYDEIGQLVTSAAAPLSAESGGGAASTVTPTATTGYNTFGELVDHRDELGNVSRTTYDRNGRVTSSARPPYQAPGAAQAVTPTTFTKYDGNSNVVEVKDPRGNITRTAYDQLNRVAKVDAPASTNDERAVTTFGYTRTGRVLSTVDPTGIRTEATFDDLDRQVTTTSIERVPAAGAFTSKVVYDDASNVVSAISPKQATTTNTYDALNQLTRSVDPNGVQVQYGYDFVGHTVRAADAQGRTSQVIYDPFGQKIADNVLKADGSTLRSTTYGYDLAGNLITVTDPNQTVRTYTYNSANQLISQVEPVADNKSITSSYGVDAAGHRTRYTDGRGNSTITTYNSLGLPESTIDPPTTAHPAAADRTWTTGYDENGNAVQMTAPGGVVTRRDHDAANRPKSETGTGAEAQTATTTYSYDLSNRLRSVSAVGGTNTYLYDDRGNLFTTAGPGGVAEFRYDEEGSVVSRKDAAGTAAFGYDKGRLDTVADGLTGTSQKFGYDNTGAIKTIDFGAGRKRTLGYDDFARLSSDVVTNSANATVASTTYGYNPTDTLASRTTTGVAGAGTTTYDYDKGYRLKSSTSGGVTTGYEWDDAGNRTKIGSKASTFDERNRLLSDGDSTYTYTPRGTLRSKTTGSQTQQFGFDALDRMITAGARTYAYDGLDRVATRDGTTFTYAGQNDEIVSDGSETYARGPGDELVATGRGDTKRLSLSDAHGDVVGGFDPADTTLGALPDSTTYDPFGKVTAKAGNTGALGFQGDWTDQSTGQVDMGARWYDPSTGGFVSRDDVDTSGGSAVNANRYGYGAGNPVSNTDPTGHYCQAGKGYTVCAPRVPVHITPPKISWWSRIGKGAKWGLGRISIPAWFAWQVLKPTQMPYDGCEHWSGGLSCGDYYKYTHNPQSVRDQFCDTHAWTKQCGGGGASPWELANEPDTDEDVDGDGDVDTQDDAAARAEAARIAAYLRAKAISDKARADNAAAAKSTPIAVSAGATKPILLPGDQVSSTSDAPAGHVGAQRDVVDDARADANDVYQRAVQAAGQIMHNVSAASRAVVVTINASDERHRLIPDQRQRQKRDCRQSLPTPNYMPVDSAHGNRATGVEACITDLSDRNEAVRGPGYEWTQKHVALNYGVEASKTINSCHLLAAVLGGDGSRYENVATCSRAANTYVRGAGRVGDNMRRFEASAADAVRSGQVVYYKVIPQYAGDRTVPVSFEMTAEGFYKDGRPGGINKHEVVPNFLYNPRGHRGNTPGMTNLGLLQDLDGRPAPTGFTK